MLGYVRRNRPHIVICENVAGLLERNRGRDPHIYQVCRDLLNSKQLLVPQRRHRVWMWAIRKDVAAAPAAEGVLDILNGLERPHPVALDKFLRLVITDALARQIFNEREQNVLEQVCRTNRPLQRLTPEDQPAIWGHACRFRLTAQGSM